ncbi:hypothetical protein ACFY0R_21000 [Streptomyces sp. NPDC001633]|uniref:hypothetical protein n=1 Tax=Streptomyces sp. NPDC001633 TaxID=3364595 RepID=UPI0036D07DBE
MDEEGEGVAELVAVEGALGLADDDGVEAALRVADYLEESGGLGRRFQGRARERPGVELLGNDLAAGGSMRARTPVSCQLREVSGSWRSSAEQRPAKAK